MNSHKQASSASQLDLDQRLTVGANAVGEQGVTVRLQVGGENQNSILLSIEEARALSLAIIAVVNKHEQHAHTQRKQLIAPVTIQPATR